MAGNTYGTLFRLTTFGESHGLAIGGVIDGCPAGLKVDLEEVQKDLDRRKPGQSKITTQRKESDEVEFLSGIFEGKTTGTPIGFIIRNADQKSKDYCHLKGVFRPSHADFTYEMKYGHRDHRGGGRSSARETACRVVGGAIAKQILTGIGVEIKAWVDRVEDIELKSDYHALDLSKIETNIIRCPDPKIAERMIARVEEIKKDGDTLGGSIFCLVKGSPVGLGEPVFDKLHAELGKAMLSINAVKGFEIGSGFGGSYLKGSDQNDKFTSKEGRISTTSNNSGGVQGGISNGEDIYFRTALKPVATIMRKQSSVDDKGKAIDLEGRGRHDPCVLPRAVPIVEAMTALVIVDFFMRSKTDKLV